MKVMISVFLCIIIVLFGSVVSAEEYGVYVKIMERAKGSFDEVSAKVERALKEDGWEILTTYETGTPEDSALRSRVIIFSSPPYTASIMSYGVKAAFALPLRIGVYEDKVGINITLLNPVAINRTMVHETRTKKPSLSTVETISTAIAEAVEGTKVMKQMGEIRKARNLGDFGNKNFRDKIVTIFSARHDSEPAYKRIIENVKYGIQHNTKNWELVYTLDLSSYGTTIFGIGNADIERMAFSIAREKKSNKFFKFPVLYHNTAFPIEVIVYKEGGKVKVVTLEEMYRMKYYFEDAGFWVFIKYFRKPGQIQDEIVEMVLDGMKRDIEQ
jgi:uncharacterized protein (DUF302 family)